MTKCTCVCVSNSRLVCKKYSFAYDYCNIFSAAYYARMYVLVIHVLMHSIFIFKESTELHTIPNKRTYRYLGGFIIWCVQFWAIRCWPLVNDFRTFTIVFTVFYAVSAALRLAEIGLQKENNKIKNKTLAKLLPTFFAFTIIMAK